MLKITSVKAAVVAGLLVAGMAIGAGVTYAVQLTFRTSFAATGLFTLYEGEWANYSATLDDNRGGPAATVLMRILDKRGAVVASQQVVLQVGQSATLPFRGVGSFRALSEIVQPDSLLGDRRRVLTTLEISFGRHEDPDGGITIPRTYVCMSSDSDGGGNGRLPD
jgi:hypothetical protein